MKKLFIVALCLFSSTSIFAGDPPVREGDKCNANNQNGRIQYFEMSSGGSNTKSTEYGGNATVNAGAVSAGANGSVRNSHETDASTKVTGYQCVTDRATYDNWNDGHIK